MTPSGVVTVLDVLGRGSWRSAGGSFQPLEVEKGAITKVLVSPSGHWFAAIAGEHLVTWRVTNDGSVAREEPIVSESPTDIFFMPSSDELVVATDSGMILVPLDSPRASSRIPDEGISPSMVAPGAWLDTVVVLEHTGAVEVWDTMTRSRICYMGPEPTSKKDSNIAAKSARELAM